MRSYDYTHHELNDFVDAGNQFRFVAENLWGRLLVAPRSLQKLHVGGCNQGFVIIVHWYSFRRRARSHWFTTTEWCFSFQICCWEKGFCFSFCFQQSIGAKERLRMAGETRSTKSSFVKIHSNENLFYSMCFSKKKKRSGSGKI